jgi:hypothetical protein
MGELRKVRDMLLEVAKSALRRFVDVPTPMFSPGNKCRVRYSVVADTGGVLLKGALVEITGVQDPSKRFQIKVLELPDYQWTETSRLPYGPNFILFVDGLVLEITAG